MRNTSKLLIVYVVFSLALIAVSLCYLAYGRQMERYVDAEEYHLSDTLPNLIPNIIPKVIWTFWDSSDVPPIVERCIKTWRKWNPGCSIIILNKDNLDDYIDNGSKLMELRRSKDFVARLADFIRVHVIATHGGVWMDASIICNKPLDDWISFDNLDNSQFVGFYMPNFTTIPEYPVIENWCFAAPPYSDFIMKWRDEFMKSNSYDTVQQYVDDVREAGVDFQNIADPKYLTMHLSAQVVLQARKYKINVMDANEGPFKYIAEDWDTRKALQRLCSNPDMYQTPIVKLRGADRSVLQFMPELVDCVVRI